MDLYIIKQWSGGTSKHTGWCFYLEIEITDFMHVEIKLITSNNFAFKGLK